MHFLNKNVSISIDISLKIIPQSPIDNILALVWIIAWRQPGDKPLSEPMMGRSLTYMHHSAIMSWCKKDLTPLPTHWICVSVAFSHQSDLLTRMSVCPPSRRYVSLWPDLRPHPPWPQCLQRTLHRPHQRLWLRDMVQVQWWRDRKNGRQKSAVGKWGWNWWVLDAHLLVQCVLQKLHSLFMT